MGRIIAVCISEKRGTEKKNIQKARFIENFGIEKDAHGGNWHRQVSLLGKEKIDAFNQLGAKVGDGAFGENLIVEGFDFKELPVGTILQCNDVILEMTQIGKECHAHCAIYNRVGDCIMPREGVFAKVLQGGEIAVGDEMILLSGGRE
ncbi:molybdenum cofactor biosynthesis protein MoaC [Anaerocolumna cellulosilytica]|uniref:Molybdenum cofactor biosynthesis protein MoaC n=1 Tax=Anaerocolumna cellulosilytica TaxID=433286 RepID=A0A6S6QT22_9FIRM|nr:MOSC domain-containing protein [Anaerocolumna cellulosilytica]MBB5194295.1 TatD DNase family protein [Anaerocolumna cellulosilytica]BCJ94493.1 molybdenum cofactor biosynthesis protein MoaC [Anaerocolumna cellulosilytica]